MQTLSSVLPAWPQFSAFLLASFVLAVTPGPGVLYIVMRSATQGRLSGIASVLGVALGNFGNALAAAFGLAALFAISSIAFALVKWIGAAYLIYLGVQIFFSKKSVDATPEVATIPLARVFREGFTVALLNPKTTIFFAAFLPQFMRADASPLMQSVVLGALFVLIAAVTDSLYALAAGALAPRMQQLPRGAKLGRVALASTFIGLGVMTALSNRRA